MNMKDPRDCVHMKVHAGTSFTPSHRCTRRPTQTHLGKQQAAPLTPSGLEINLAHVGSVCASYALLIEAQHPFIHSELAQVLRWAHCRLHATPTTTTCAPCRHVDLSWRRVRKLGALLRRSHELKWMWPPDDPPILTILRHYYDWVCRIQSRN
jgi:hypothetical protein